MFEMLMCLVAILMKEELHKPGKLGSRDFLLNYPHLVSGTCYPTLVASHEAPEDER